MSQSHSLVKEPRGRWLARVGVPLVHPESVDGAQNFWLVTATGGVDLSALFLVVAQVPRNLADALCQILGAEGCPIQVRLVTTEPNTS